MHLKALPSPSAKYRRSPRGDGDRTGRNLQSGRGHLDRYFGGRKCSEENILGRRCVLTRSEQVVSIGGAPPLTGVDSGTARNYQALVDAPYQFDLYDGGGLDIASPVLCRSRPEGQQVNISRFGDKIVGVGGFINIAARTPGADGVQRHLHWLGGLKDGGAGETAVGCGSCKKADTANSPARSSRSRWLVRTFHAEQGRTALFVTERALFRATIAGLELVEVAPGIDLERDILAHMDFKPAIAAKLKDHGRTAVRSAIDGPGERPGNIGDESSAKGIARMSADDAPVASQGSGLGARLLAILWGSMPALVFVALIAIWWAAVDIFNVAAYLLPPPQDVLPRIFSSRQSLRNHSLVTMQEIVMGFGLSVVTAIPMGLLIALSPAAKRMLYPFLMFIQLVPKIAIAPLFVVWVGFGMTSKVLLTLLLTFFPLLLACIAGFQILDQRLLYPDAFAGRTRSGAMTFRYLRFPAALLRDLRRPENLRHHRSNRGTSWRSSSRRETRA